MALLLWLGFATSIYSASEGAANQQAVLVHVAAVRSRRTMGVCSQGSPARLLAVLGVFSIDSRASLRSVLRETAFSTAPADILPCFALRGLGGSAVVRAEAAEYGDMVLLPANASLPRSVGPLVTLELWYVHTLAAFPLARFVGKADDDCYWDGQRVALQLRALSADEATAGGWYWGRQESYSINPISGHPSHFGWAPLSADCVVRGEIVDGQTRALVGPFPFSKGPLNFLSAGLVSLLTGNLRMRQQLRDVVRNRLKGPEGGWSVWEDVYTGYLLSQVRPPFAAAAAQVGPAVLMRLVNLGKGLYAEEGKHSALGKNSTIVFHFGYKQKKWLHSQIRGAHAMVAARPVGAFSACDCSGVIRETCARRLEIPQGGQRWATDADYLKVRTTPASGAAAMPVFVRTCMFTGRHWSNGQR
mmetsp:Transcript_10032/g.25222  ORF Transcript_10032/g.25222 Transcript_10032/m.25222 type:complete len:417 (+) Transcript_10032:269-1519(+)